MENFNRKEHWENIYQTKELKNVSWYQPTPQTALDFINHFNISKTAKIIDIGGGDSFLVDHLLELGYQNITVLDISEKALDKAKLRLGSLASKVNWIVADISTFVPKEQYDFWYDRAAFHFLTQKEDINNYVETVQQGLHPDGVFVLGTFSENGPKKCSGIEIKQYSKEEMIQQFNRYFEKVKCISIDHTTPSSKVQNFIFCSFKKLALV